MYEGLIAWVGQDVLVAPSIRLSTLARNCSNRRPLASDWGAIHRHRGVIARVRAPFVAKQPPIQLASTSSQRAIAVILILLIYFAISVAHQLTPYMALAGIGAPVLLGLLWRGWVLFLAMTLIAVGYTALHYNIISQQFGGIFSGGNVLDNASGVHVFHHGAEAMTAGIVRALAISMWLLALAAVLRKWRALGQVAIIAALAFSPFVILFAQRYGGEAIYRVFLFSSPWCALLIAGTLVKPLSIRWRQMVAVCVCAAALAAGLQGLYGLVAVDAFTPAEVTASLWLYSHAKHGSLVLLAAGDFPVLETADYNHYGLRPIPADPLIGTAWLNERNVAELQAWIANLGYSSTYVVFSHAMAEYADYYGAPFGYSQLVSAVRNRRGWSAVYQNADTIIYRVYAG